MNEVFTIESVTNNLVVLKVSAKDPLTVAMHPYVAGNYEYISVTRGKEHVLTIVHSNGTKFDFHWGESGYTLIGDSLEILKREVCKFIEDNNIFLGLTDDANISNVDIFYNNNFNSWQIMVENQKRERDYILVKTDNVEDVINRAECLKLNISGWKKGIAQTGIPIWRAILS